MPDHKRRELERIAAEGTAQDLARLLREQLRQGLLTWELAVAAVHRFPRDDELRRTVADWLGPDSPRGAFIDAQLQLAAGAMPLERPALRQRVKTLLAMHEAEWTAPLGLRGTWRWRRGFLDDIEATAAELVEAADRLFAHEPVSGLSLTFAHTLATAPLADANWLTHVRRLKLRGGLDASFTKGLAELAQLTDLESLNLGENPIGPDGAAALGESAHLQALRTLALSGTSIGDTGLAALLRDTGARPTALYLSRNGLTDASLKTLAASPACAKLSRLAVGGNWAVTDAGAQALLDSSQLPALRWVEVGDTEVSEDRVNAMRQRGWTVRL